jgi:hypothetical protein
MTDLATNLPGISSPNRFWLASDPVTKCAEIIRASALSASSALSGFDFLNSLHLCVSAVN